MSEISCDFPQFSCTLLYEIITVRQGSHKFCATLVPKMFTDAHKTQRMASALTFFSDTTKIAMNFSVPSYE
jgi:hypothetical protein